MWKTKVYNALAFVKTRLRNELDKNLENYLRIFESSYEVECFPYDRALTYWKSLTKRININKMNEDDNDSDKDIQTKVPEKYQCWLDWANATTCKFISN